MIDEGNKSSITQFISRGTDYLYPETKLKENLLRCFPDLATLHAHQSNIQTFIREQEDLEIEKFSQL